MINRDHLDVRLPDAVTVQDGPVEEIAQFLLLADRTARDRGIHLRVRTDMDELIALNERETALGNWYRGLPIYDPQRDDVDETNAYWISGTTEDGKTVVAQAGRLFHWPDSNLTDEMVNVLYPRTPDHAPFYVTCANAASVSGTVCLSGSTWFHPEYRRLGLARILPRVSRVFAFSQWNTDWTVSFITRELVALNIASAYGYSDVQFGVQAPGHPLGELDLALVRMPRSELFSDIKRFVAERTAASRQVA
tara:strand:+ start:273 stop:1022 length:750 start_codon:yes stop_codon:yes gene_type:complete